jgi:hypothetical protein
MVWIGIMNILTKAGLIFLILGGLSFLGLVFLVLCFGIGGGWAGTGNYQRPGWFVALLTFIFYVGLSWWVFLIIGAVLIVAGFLRARYS